MANPIDLATYKLAKVAKSYYIYTVLATYSFIKVAKSEKQVDLDKSKIQQLWQLNLLVEI